MALAETARAGRSAPGEMEALLGGLDLFGVGWTEDRAKALRLLWREGYSAKQIAKRLGGITRNAVIGKVHRLGLAGRAMHARIMRREPSAPRSRTPAYKRPPALPPDPAPVVVSPILPPVAIDAEGRFASVLTVRDSMCKFPIGDPKEGDFAFCGRGVATAPYCAEHHRLAYTPPAKRKRAARADDHHALLKQLEASMRPVPRGYMKRGYA